MPGLPDPEQQKFIEKETIEQNKNKTWRSGGLMKMGLVLVVVAAVVLLLERQAAHEEDLRLKLLQDNRTTFTWKDIGSLQLHVCDDLVIFMSIMIPVAA